MSADWAWARRITRALTWARSVTSEPSKVMPSSLASSMSAISSAVAISVLLGTQSVSTAEPPIPSVSTTVTSAPSWAATRAASYPPGPPPTTTT